MIWREKEVSPKTASKSHFNSDDEIRSFDLMIRLLYFDNDLPREVQNRTHRSFAHSLVRLFAGSNESPRLSHSCRDQICLASRRSFVFKETGLRIKFDHSLPFMKLSSEKVICLSACLSIYIYLSIHGYSRNHANFFPFLSRAPSSIFQEQSMCQRLSHLLSPLSSSSLSPLSRHHDLKD